MIDRPLNIIQINRNDISGGASKIAWDLFQNYNNLGHDSYLIVGSKISDNKKIITLSNTRFTKLSIFFDNLLLQLCTNQPAIKYANFIKLIISRWSNFNHIYCYYKGYDDFYYPETWQILQRIPVVPDIIHCHNLHTGYFDLNALPWLSKKFPLVITLHDAWLLSGHCAHSFDCTQWKFGCKKCHHLSYHPSIKRDQASNNWVNKKDIFEKSVLNIVTPCNWLMDKVQQSILAPACNECAVIPNGIDLKIFNKINKNHARTCLNLPLDSKIILFTAAGIKKNPFKDFKMFWRTLKLLSNCSKHKIIVIGLGEMSENEKMHNIEIRYVPFQKNSKIVALYYQAADIYAHPTQIDTFPTSILEAMACGNAIIASNAGGISEQIDDHKTGLLVPIGNSEKFANSLEYLINDENICLQLGENAIKKAKKYYDLDIMTNSYLNFYKKIMP